MQLRVLPTRLSMNKCSDQHIDFLPLVAALPASRVAEVIAQILQRLIDGPLKSLFDMAAVVLRAHRPQGRHVLWHTEAEVERRASVVFPVILGELLARPGVVAIEQLLDIFFLDHAGEAKREGRVIQVPRPRAFTARRCNSSARASSV